MFVNTEERPADPADHSEAPEMSDRQLEEELCSQAAHLAAAECHLVLLIAEFDRREVWAGCGLHSCAHWLNWRCGVALGAAREQVRVGRALRTLPVVREAFGAGQLSYSKVRALTRVATAEIEEGLVEIARATSASQLETVVREYRRADPDEAPRALARHARRFVRTFTDDEGMVVIHARLSPEDGAAVLGAIEAARQALRADRAEGESPAGPQAGADPGDPPDVPAGTTRGTGQPCSPGEGFADEHEHERADALVALCESVPDGRLGRASGGPGALVVVHVDEAVLEDPTRSGCCFADRAGALAAHSARRLACDAVVSRLVHRADGEVVPEGRTRSIPARIRRAVLGRDRGCRFPGCTRVAFVDLHHVVFWAQGGRTIARNLLCLCRRHHRLVHEGGYEMEVDASGRLSVRTPEGGEIPATPPPLVAAGPGVVEDHRRRGLGIDDTTLEHGGERFDLGLTIDALLCRAGKIGVLPVGAPTA